MEQHPIPRQITTFEFKLIGFMTLKQFLYLVVFIPTAFIVWKLVPVPILNIVCGGLIAAAGLAFAFVPINDRPMEVWIRNFIKRVTSPTQYLYHKQNSGLNFLKELYFTSDPHKVLAHIETQEKLSAYLQKTKSPTKHIEERGTQKKQQIQTLLRTPDIAPVNRDQKTAPAPVPSVVYRAQQTPTLQQPQVIHSVPTHPAMTGVIKNKRQIPLPGILVYIKDATGKPIRLLKTNPHGIFATFNPLSPGDYEVEMKDPNGGYIFDRMKVTISGAQQPSYEFYSKEMI